MSAMIDITGMTFGRLTVIEENGRLGRQVAWKCQCKCGDETTVRGTCLRSGRSKSCGCITGENHGESRTPTYKSWCQMWDRCNNPNCKSFANYGGRGISVCDQWKSYKVFRRDMGPRLDGVSIERIDNNGGYEPTNCRWATAKDQANNRRSSRRITWKGERKTVAEWEDATGVSQFTIRRRIDDFGWSINKALSTKPSREVKSTNRWISFRGERMTVAQWARATSLTKSAIGRRLDRGWSVEDALTIPLRSRRG